MITEKGITVRERVFVQKYVDNGGNGTGAALQAYNCTSPESADAVAREALGRPRVQRAIQELMKDHGLDDDTLLIKHRELLEDPHPAIRLKALDMAYKLSGRYESKIILEDAKEKFIPKDPMRPPILLTREELLGKAEIIQEYEREEKAFKERCKKELAEGFTK